MAVKGVVASALAVAGLVVFATAASAHNNGLQSVTAVCGTTTPGEIGVGATLSWTMYNNWALSETGTLSTTQGTLSTTTLSIAASPTNDAVPPAAASQTFTQSLTASELAALSPTTPINVDWDATWSDTYHLTGTLTTTLAELDLPNDCVAAPSTTTTQVSNSSVVVGTSVTDTATVTGNGAFGVPTGTVTFVECGPISSDAVCANGTDVGSAVTLSSGKATSDPFTPSAAGTYCFAAVYTPVTNGSYEVSSDNLNGTVQSNECFVVTAAPPNFTVTKTDMPASGTGVTPGSTIDYTIAIKNVGAGAGSGTVTDVVPSSLTVGTSPAPACAVTSPDTCSVANTTGTTWTFTVSLAAGDTATATFAATVAAAATVGSTITNTATITSGPCTTPSGCSSSVSNPVVATSAATVTPTTPTAATTAATTTSPTTSASTTPALATTGAQLSQEWMAGLAALLLGSGLVLLARWRRRIPRHAASKK